MRVVRAIVFSAAAALITTGCEVRTEPAPVAVSGDVAVDSGGPVVDAPGVEVIDADPDPAQRVYVYDEGYPPGCYVYNNYVYYGGYRYPRDVFVNRYVQENVRQHRYVNTEENRRQGQQIEQRHRTEFATNHGVRNNRTAARQAGQPDARQPARQDHQDAERHDNAPAAKNDEHRTNVGQPENRQPANDEHRTNVGQPENRQPANDEHRTNVGQPENRQPANDEHRTNVRQPENRPPANDEHRTNSGQPENRTSPQEEHRQTEARPTNNQEKDRADRKTNADEPKHDEAK